MRKRILFHCFLMFYVLQVFSQKEAWHWYFGNGVALDFSSGNVKAVNDGQLYTNEGCASVSDKDGRLLFYSDGVSVWNKEHKLIAEGLNGANSSTQSCIILKNPASEALYYLFTIDELAGPKGLSYSVIDMKQNNGSGAVTIKNKLLLTPTSEKLTAVRHSNGKGWWVIVHQWNSAAFYCYMLDANGISAPVISNIGTVQKDSGTGKNAASIGYLKGSPDGTKLASAICYVPNNNIELFDFNNTSGVISNPVNLPSPGNAYGTCFSPDGTKLYVSYESRGRGIVQYDLTVSGVAKSAVRVSPVDSTRYGAMQIGPDDRIYAAKLGQFLDVITNPNGTGSGCGFKTDQVDLKGMYSTFGLPDFFLSDYTNIKVNLGNDTVVCEKSYTLDAKNSGATYRWSTGEREQKITIARTGTYWVAVNKNGQTATDTVKIKFRKPIILELGRDTVLCGEMYPIDAGNSGLGYRWSSGASSQVFVAKETGNYSVTVTDGICTKTDFVKVTFANSAKPFIPSKEFEPGNGGLNSHFDYILNGVTWFSLKIKNKRGKVVFETDDRSKKWNGYVDGKRVAAGNYAWELRYKTACTRDKINEQKGVVIVN
ncbi:MAG: gliding motility-associated C-terminal domain-containing protein [Bacteroidetes bacterium]|nr:gliding motility-associated C-terminal domain-containing protein [Bacteroidota bacterium]